MSADLHHRILIIGGGTAGISVAARLSRRLKHADLAIIEPSDKHYYQPLWTLVGAGVFPKEASEREEADFIPTGATWVRDAVAEFLPEENRVITRDGRSIRYEYMVVATGIQIDWGRIKGLEESIGHGGVCSNYAYQHVDYTWECLRKFEGGNAVFTMPSTPIKCGGAPQKIMYLGDDHFRKSGAKAKARVIYASGLGNIFAVPRYAQTLDKVIARRGIETLFLHDLVEVRSATKEAIFRRLDTAEEVVLPYDMIHVTPPMSAPDVVKRSPLADAAGWVEVDKFTLRHPRFPNVFGLGDSSGLPTSKTGAAIRKQSPVVVRNLIAAMSGAPLPARYDGYTSCPLVTGYGKLVLAEFDYDKHPAETFPFDQSKERRSMYLLKAYGLPWLYWHAMMRGRG